MDKPPQHRFWIFQYTNGTQTDQLLKRGSVDDEVPWLWSSNRKQTPEEGDFVFFLRSGKRETEYPAGKPWRGITGFGEVLKYPVTLQNRQSDTGVGVGTLEAFQDDPLPDFLLWHDHRLAGTTVLFSQQGTNFLISETAAIALFDQMLRPDIAWPPMERVALHDFAQIVSSGEQKDQLTAEINRIKAWMSPDVAISLQLARALSERSTGRGWMSWTLLFMGLILRLHNYPGTRKPSRLASALLEITMPDGDASVLRRYYSSFTNGDVDPVQLKRQDAGPIENLSERSSISLSQARNFAGNEPISVDALIAGLLNTHSDDEAYESLFGCDKKTLLERLIVLAYDEERPRDLDVFLQWVNRPDLSEFAAKPIDRGEPPEMPADVAETPAGDADAAREAEPDIASSDETLDKPPSGDEPADLDQTPPPGRSEADDEDPVHDIIQTAGAITDDATREADYLKVRHEANAFARLIASTSFEPPIAIGVFGHWGSGKSYFMNKIEAGLKELTGDKDRKAGEASKPKAPGFHGNIVRIPFNAWHYMETNVWASLVDVIFKELDGWLRAADENPEDIDAVFDSLSTAQTLRLDAIEQLAARLEAQENARQALEKESKHRLAHWGTVARNFKKDDAIKSDFDSAIDAFGLTGLIEDAKKLKTAIALAQETTSQADLVWKALRLRVANPRLLGLLAAAVLIVPAAAIKIAGEKDLSELAATLTGLTTAATGWLSYVTLKAKKGVAALSALKTAFDKAEKELADNKQDTISEFDANVENAEAQLAFAIDAVAEAQRNLFNNSAAGQIAAFIRARAEGDTYSRHLGIINMIRRDFEQLTLLMAKARSEGDMEQTVIEERSHELVAQIHTRVKMIKSRYSIEGSAGEDDQHRRKMFEPVRDALEKIETSLNAVPNLQTRFDRIVLFIDDLDRCPPDKVYEVLQAIHLFLCFPLFVVIVGVDTRWMETSLETELDKLVDGSSGASAQDYLEKIFQIPYWTRRMNADAAGSFVAQLVSRAQADDDRSKDSDPNTDEPLVSVDDEIQPGKETKTDRKNPPDKEPDLEDDLTVDLDTPIVDAATNPTEQSEPEQADGKTEETDAAELQTTTRPVVITESERKLLTEFAPFAGNSPRKLLRFVNVYGLIKSVSDTNLDKDAPETSQELTLDPKKKPLQARALIFQLAISTGDPNVASSYFEELERLDSIGDAGSPGAKQSKTQALLEIAAAGLTSDQSKEEFLKILKQTAPTARRYTFASPDAIDRKN